MMPLSGNFKELPFPEVLCLLRSRTGELQMVDQTSGERFSFGLSSGKLVSASEAGEPIPDTLALHSVIQRISTNEWASFVFEESRGSEPCGPLAIPIDQILLSALAAIQSPERVAAYLPHPDARFRAAAEMTPWLTEELLNFWVSTERLLHSGSSATEIAAALGLPLPQVLLELFKLRLLGVIAPLQAKPSAPPLLPLGRGLSTPELPPAPAPAPIASLPPEDLPAPEAVPLPPPPSKAPSSSPTIRSVPLKKPTAPRRGIFARIAAGLRRVLEKMYE